MSSLRVAVRCRPFSAKEKKAKQQCIIAMSGNETILTNPREDDDLPPRKFSFEYSFWSHGKRDAHYTTQADVYAPVGESVLSDAFAGYHTCVFAYGQTGSGKSHTMMGTPSDPIEQGITPRLCQDLFSRIEAQQAANPKWFGKVEVSYMEIYLEQVRDLLNPSSTKKLRVREHSLTGPYVENLSTHAVSDFKMVKALMDEGDKLRTVRATKMNDVSSRSHAIFQIIFSQGTRTVSGKSGKSKELVDKKSKISLVDLAGSERSGQINARNGERMEEGNQINKSLSCLGKVMTALAERRPGKKNQHQQHIPYRESVLTWLLRESLGGNSKTFMLAAISPAAENFEETLSTLRYANAAKKIVNAAVVNEDPTTRLIRMLEEEIDTLKAQLAQAKDGSGSGGASAGPKATGASEGVDVDPHHEATQKLTQLTVLMETLQTPWEEKVNQTASMQRDRLLALSDHGGLVVRDQSEAESKPVGVMAPETVPYLVNLAHDPFSRHCLVYYLRHGETVVTAYSEHDGGGADVPAISEAPTITLQDVSIRENHCTFVTNTQGPTGATVRLVASADEAAEVRANGRVVKGEVYLRPGDTVVVGTLAFMFQNPSDPLSSNSSSPLSLSPSTPIFGHRRCATIEEDMMSPSPPRSRRGSIDHRAEFSPLRPRRGKRTARRRSERREAVDAAMEGVEAIVPRVLSTRHRRTSSDDADVLFEWDKEHESSYLVHLVVNMASAQFSFKLMPAYGLYMMFHGQRARDEEAALEELQTRVARLVQKIVRSSRRERNVRKLALLLANSSELFHAMKSDEYLVSTSGAAQVMMLEAAEEAFSGLVLEAKRRIRPCLPAVLREDAMASSEQEDLPGRARYGTMKQLIESLSALHDLVESTLMSEDLVLTIFDQLFFYLGAKVWNDFIMTKEKNFYRWDRGLLIRFNLAQLTDWAEARGIDASHQLRHITQACLLLQTNKSSLAFLDTVCSACPSLNSKQVAKILRNYTPAEGDAKVPPSVIDCIVGRAMTVADLTDVDDPEAGCAVRLERNVDFELPFHLIGQFHIDEGVYNRPLLEDAKAYLRVIDMANQDTAMRTVASMERSEAQSTSPCTPDGSPRQSMHKPHRQSFFGRWMSSGERSEPESPVATEPYVSAREWIGVPS
eukprot:m.182364 g.182364  ORF g.182364 m.182364 type:complete len:1142 (+) comp15512_c0_seq1:275-3700(+)